jgi:hypothetical protein
MNKKKMKYMESRTSQFVNQDEKQISFSGIEVGVSTILTYREDFIFYFFN